MFAFQICNVPETDQKILHFEFLGCIAEGIDEDTAAESEDHKRGALNAHCQFLILCDHFILLLSHCYLYWICSASGIDAVMEDNDVSADASSSKRSKRANI